MGVGWPPWQWNDARLALDFHPRTASLTCIFFNRFPVFSFCKKKTLLVFRSCPTGLPHGTHQIEKLGAEKVSRRRAGAGQSCGRRASTAAREMSEKFTRIGGSSIEFDFVVK